MSSLPFIDRLLGRNEEARTQWIEAEDLRSRLSGSSPPALVDVRGPDEFVGELGHIADAANIPLGELEGRMDEIAALGPREIVLVCLSDKRSARAADILKSAGVNDISVLKGGMVQWTRLGFQVKGRAGER